MKTIKKMAAISVLLFGAAQAQNLDNASGAFNFIVDPEVDISCNAENATQTIAGEGAVDDIIIPSSGTAAASPAEIVCDIKMSYEYWDVKIAAQNSGKLVDANTGNLRINGEDASLAIYAKLEADESSEIKIAENKSAVFGDAEEIPDAGFPKNITENTPFSLAGLLREADDSKLCTVDGSCFMNEGLVQATLTIKGAVLSASEKTNITSGAGSYMEILRLELDYKW